MMNHKEVAAVVAGVVPAVKEFLDKSLGAFSARLAAAETRTLEKGEPGPAGENGKDADPVETARLVETEVTRAVAALEKPADGKSVTLEDVRPLIEEIVAKIPAPKDGKDASPAHIAALVSSQIAKAVEQLPKAIDGKSVTLEDVRPLIEEIFGKIPVPKDGAAGSQGEKGEPGIPGLKAEECLVPDDLAIEIGKSIALLAESPSLVPKSAQPIVVKISNEPQPSSGFKMKRNKDGSLDIEPRQEA